MSKDWWLFRQVLCPFSSWKYNTSSLTPVLACHRLADLHQLNYSQDTFSHKCVFWTTLECQWEHRQRNVLKLPPMFWSRRDVCVSCMQGPAMSGLQSATEPSSQVVEPAGWGVRTEPQQTRLAASCSSRLWSRTPTWRLCSSWEGGRQSPHCETTRYRYSARQPAHWACQKCQNCCETKPENGANLIYRTLTSKAI